ncbi:MAG: cupin domain-containing protein [Chitinophagaceae bacterium]|jgi:quercetin dioxygenase-like cupin family protein|nr:MAG: cupin domain-containing protein [Chitinophagaceae bacterium]
MHITFPRTIANAGETITFLGTFIKDGVEILEADMVVQPNAGPPMHTHYRQDESFTVVSGTMAWQVAGQKPEYAYAGETVLIKAGVPHKFWNAGTDVLRCKGHVTPPENFVYFLTEVYKSLNANKGRPGMYDGAFLLNRYKSEFAMDEIPAFVQKFIFPVVLFFGNLLGRNKKFVNAPSPLKS